jgi:phenylacetate-CoA ligase
MGSVSETSTSGSTGSPVRVKVTSLSSAIWAAITLRDHVWHGRDARLTNAAIRWRVENTAMAPAGATVQTWGEPLSRFYQTGKFHYLNSASDVAEQAVWLLQRNPDYLISHPSNLVALLDELTRLGDCPSSLAQLRTVGEALPDALRDSVREQLGIPLVDLYSAQEVGYLALQCPEHEHYHVQSESVFVELLNESGLPVAPGESGRVVVTDLRNYAFPLIRYDIGDYAMWGEACACGRGLPVLSRIHGRARGMLRLPDGSQRWPNFGFRQIAGVVSLRQFQLVQHGLEQLELKVVAERPMRLDQEKQVKQILREYLRHNFEIQISYHPEIPRAATGKYEDFVSLL